MRPLQLYQKGLKVNHLESALRSLKIVMPYLRERLGAKVNSELQCTYLKACFFDTLKTFGAKEALVTLAGAAEIGGDGPQWTKPAEIMIDCVSTALYEGLQKPLGEKQRSDKYEES